MNYLKLPLVVLLSMAITGLLTFVPAGAQGTTALERGYRTGYSDGYTAGFKDVSDHAARDFKNKQDYQQADRSFNDAWGPIEDYRDGYQQGYESGYAAGFDQQQFNSALPTGLRRRQNPGNIPVEVNNTSGTPDAEANVDNNTPSSNGSLAIPRNTILNLE